MEQITEIVENIKTEIGPIQDAESDTRNIQGQFIEEDDVQIAERYSLSGFDSVPPVGAKHLVTDLDGGWKISHAENDGVEPDSSLDAGETRIYSSDGSVQAEINLKKDGSINIVGGSAVINLKADGAIDIDAGPKFNIEATKIVLGDGTNELLSLFNDNLTEVITALKFIRDTITFSNGGGPTGPPANGAVLSPTITNLEATQTALGSIKE